MDESRGIDWGPAVVAGFGAVLFAAAVAHHLRELAAVDGLAGPLSALALDGPPALALAYAGYRLRATDLDGHHTRQVARWCLAGAGLFAATLGVSMAIRAMEGRVVTEPTFTLLLAAGVGGLAGYAAAYYRVRAAVAARDSERTAKALEFVNSVIRHDLRNDLQVVLGNAQRVEAKAEVPAVADSGATIRTKASQSVDRIEMTEGLVDALTGSADLEPVDLVPVVREVTDRTRETTAATVETDLPEAAVVVANDGLRSVVDNLVENAVEHNDAADPEVEVTVSATGDIVRLAVRDNGPGIPPAERETLFESPADAPPGGLQIAQTLVASYGGSVRAEDASPRGTRLVVELPAAGEANASGDAPAA